MSVLDERDDAPFLTREMAQRGELWINGKMVRAATGTVTNLGRPPAGEAPKQQVSLRLDRDVIAYFRSQGAGWQTRLNAALRKAAGLPV